MPSGLPPRAPSNDCVQNHAARASVVTATRSVKDFQRALDGMTRAISGAISGELIAKFLDAPQVEFAGAEIRHDFDAAELVGAGFPERGQVQFAQFGEDLLQRFLSERVQNNQALAFFFVGDRGDDKDLFGCAGHFLKFFFHLDVRNHFAADLAEAAQAIGDADEAIFINGGDVAGVVPAVVQNFGGFFRLVEVALHDVGTSDEEQTRLVDGLNGLRFRIDGAQHNSGKRMANAAALGPHLAEERGAKIHSVHSDDRRAFSAAIAFERPDAELVLEGFSDLSRQFFRAGNDVAEAAEIFGSAALGVGAEKRGCREKQGDAVLGNESANGARIERIGMVNGADADGGGQAQRAGESKGMKKGQDAEDAVVVMQHEDLIELFDVGSDVEMGQQDAFGIAGGTAGKNNGGQVVEAGLAFGAGEFFNDAGREEQRGEECDHAFAQPRFFGEVFQVDGFAGRLDFNLFQKGSRSDGGGKATLLRARLDHRLRRGVVEVDGNLAGEHGGKIDQGSADGRRQKDAHAFLALPVRTKAPRQKNGLGKR